MNPTLKFIFSLSILFPVVAGVMRYKNADTSFRPFLYLIFISLFNELLVGLCLADLSREIQTLNWKIFNLIQWVLLLLQFHYWGRLKKYKYLFTIILVVSLAGFVFEDFIHSSIYAFNPVFLISYSFVIVILSINTINSTVAEQNQSLNKNGLFFICIGLVIFFIYTIIVFLFLALDIKTETLLMRKIFNIHVYVNTITNLIYAVGIYYIPVSGVHDAFFRKQQKNIL
ncbi:MAG TPA: hypothetical protein VKA49_17190 [Flavitalea sp.]|nr:hypothetical protein [Flavitalea sp.]